MWVRHGAPSPRSLTDTVSHVEILLRGMIRVAENLILLIAGLALGYVAVWAMPGRLWPVLVGTLGMTAGGKLMFEGVFTAFGVGLIIATTVSLGYFAAFSLGVGVD